MNATRVRCAIYLRQSLDATGEQLAVQRQREDCERIARERGWSVVAEYVDNSRSASDRRKVRPGYDALVQAFAAGEFDALVCWDLDRLTRQPRQLEDWIDAAEERGLVLVTANGEADLSTDGGRLFARIKASVARAEIERKSARQRSAAVQRSANGRPPLGTRLTGYTPKGDLVAAEVPTVESVFERFAAGDSLRSLAVWLGETGVPTRHGGRWSPSSVSTILRNPRYAGRAIYDGEQTGKRGTWQAIVTDETFDLVQARLDDPRRKTNRVGTDRRHLGSGLYACVLCGEGEGARKVSSWSGDRYRCREGHLTRARGPIDDFVLRVLRGRLALPDLAEIIAPPGSAQAQALSDEAKILRGRLTKVDEDYDADLITAQRHKIKSEKIRAELKATEAALGRLSVHTGATSTLLAPDPVAAFDAAPLMVRRSVLDALCVVRLSPGVRGRRTFDPASVEIEWRS